MMRWDELEPDAKRDLLKLAANLLQAETAVGRPPRCAACYYWRQNWPLVASLKSGGNGECRRRAPQNENGFPITLADEWCGDGRMLTVDELARRLWDERRKQPKGAQ